MPSTKMMTKLIRTNYIIIHLPCLFLPSNLILPGESPTIGLKIIFYYFPTTDVQIQILCYLCKKILYQKKISFAYILSKNLIHYAYCSADTECDFDNV